MELLRQQAPVLGDDDHSSYKAFAARWESPQEGAMLKKLIDRFDGQGIVLNTANPEDTPEQGKPDQGKSAMGAAAKRATKLGK